MEKEDIALILFPGIVVSMEFVVGSLLGENKMIWYNKLKKPYMTAPNWLFFPMWTFLYIMIGLSGYIIWMKHKGFSSELMIPWVSYFVQLTLNYCFTPLFFRLHMLFSSVVFIIIIETFIIINFVIFTRLDYLAGLCLVPYVLWVAYATYLTIGIYVLNGKDQNVNTSREEAKRLDTAPIKED